MTEQQQQPKKVSLIGFEIGQGDTKTDVFSLERRQNFEAAVDVLEVEKEDEFLAAARGSPSLNFWLSIRSAKTRSKAADLLQLN